MKIRLIEPEPPGMHVWAKVLLPRLGLPIIAATLKAAGHDVLVYNPTMAPIDWDDVNTSDLVGLSSTTSTATTAYEFSDGLRARGIPTVIGGSHVTFMADEALEHVDYVARGEGGEQLMLELIEALAGDRELDTITGLSFTRDGAAVHNPQRAALADLDELPFPDLRLLVGSRQAHDHADHDQLGLPVRLHLLFRDGDVRQEVPLPQRRERHRRAQGQAARAHLLLRRQLRRQQEATQEAPPDDDRRGPRRAVVGAGAHRRGARPRAPGPHAALGLPPGLPGLRVGQPGDPRQLREGTDRRRHPQVDQGAARVRHQEPRHVRARRRHRRRADGARHGLVRQGEPDRHRDAQHPHATPRHAAVQGVRRGGRGSSTSAGSSTTRTTWCSSRGA